MSETIQQAIERSIRQDEIAHVEYTDGDIHALVSGLDGDYDYVEIEDGVYDIWSLSGPEWRLSVTIGE